MAQLRQRVAGRVQHPGAQGKGSEWEYFHANAIDLDSDGNFLVSARNTSTIYKINRATGKIMWRLGGKKSDFKLGPGVRFDWQHSIRAQPDGRTRIYDNRAAPPVRKASRAITVRLDTPAKTATLVSAFKHPRKLLSASQGNVERCPTATCSSAGARSAGSPSSARPARCSSTATSPAATTTTARSATSGAATGPPPKVVATTKGGSVTAHVSWNGATNVTRWELLAGANARTLTPIGSAAKAGFETTVARVDTQPFVARAPMTRPATC